MEKQVLIDINDPRSGKIAEALANPTCKKILNLLAENEMSATDLANKMQVPLNTVTYNIEKLIDSGLIEKTSKILWSIKGKQIPKYKLSNKKIIISPKTMTKGFIPAILCSLLVAAGIKYFYSTQGLNEVKDFAVSEGTSAAGEMAKIAAPSVDNSIEVIRHVPEIINKCYILNDAWAWFILGALVAILIFLLWNMKGGNR